MCAFSALRRNWRRLQPVRVAALGVSMRWLVVFVGAVVKFAGEAGTSIDLHSEEAARTFQHTPRISLRESCNRVADVLGLFGNGAAEFAELFAACFSFL